MNVMTSRSHVPNGETVVRVEDAIEAAREKRNSPDDSTYGSMSDSLRDSATRKTLKDAEGHVNRGYEPVSTENIHAVSSQPQPANEPKPAPRASRKKEAPLKPTAEKSDAPQQQPEQSDGNEKKLPPVRSARVRPGPTPQAQ